MDLPYQLVAMFATEPAVLFKALLLSSACKHISPTCYLTTSESRGEDGISHRDHYKRKSFVPDVHTIIKTCHFTHRMHYKKQHLTMIYVSKVFCSLKQSNGNIVKITLKHCAIYIYIYIALHAYSTVKGKKYPVLPNIYKAIYTSGVFN